MPTARPLLEHGRLKIFNDTSIYTGLVSLWHTAKRTQQIKARQLEPIVNLVGGPAIRKVGPNYKIPENLSTFDNSSHWTYLSAQLITAVQHLACRSRYYVVSNRLYAAITAAITAVRKYSMRGKTAVALAYEGRCHCCTRVYSPKHRPTRGTKYSRYRSLRPPTSTRAGGANFFGCHATRTGVCKVLSKLQCLVFRTGLQAPLQLTKSRPCLLGKQSTASALKESRHR